MTELTQLAQALDATSIGKWKAYPSYKDSGVEWLEEIPEHWDNVLLKRYLLSLKDGPMALLKELFKAFLF